MNKLVINWIYSKFIINISFICISIISVHVSFNTQYDIIYNKNKNKNQFTMQLMLSSRIVIIFINSLVIDVMFLVDKLPRVVQSNKKKINRCT